MTFSNDVVEWGNSTLNHKEANLEGCLFFVEYQLGRQKVKQEEIERIKGDARTIFFNHYVQTSHFVNFVNTNRLAYRERGDFFKYLLLYLKQFYPNHDFLKKIQNESDLRELFDKCYRTMYLLLNQFLDSNSLESANNNIDLINRILSFYRIIEDFMIRFYGYSIVGVSGQNHIITAASNCDERFMDQLAEGYSLLRMQKVGLVNGTRFEFLPALPTKDVGFPIEEYIEVGDDDKMENKTIVKVS